MTQKLLLFCVMLLALPGCMLDRSALGCPEGSMYEPGGSLCVPLADADSPDGSLPLDGGVDAWIPDGDAGPLPDAWIDPDGGVDAGTDAGSDGGRDAGPPPTDAGMRRCEDSTSGVCIRFTNAVASPPVVGWVAGYFFTIPSGALYEVAWSASCGTGFRTIDARTTECEFEVPDPGMPVRAGSGVTIYAYPTYAAGPACDTTRCPEFYMGYEMWRSGVPFSTVPSDGIVSAASRPTPAGTIIVLRIDTTL